MPILLVLLLPSLFRPSLLRLRALPVRSCLQPASYNPSTLELDLNVNQDVSSQITELLTRYNETPGLAEKPNHRPRYYGPTNQPTTSTLELDLNINQDLSGSQHPTKLLPRYNEPPGLAENETTRLAITDRPTNEALQDVAQEHMLLAATIHRAPSSLPATRHAKSPVKFKKTSDAAPKKPSAIERGSGIGRCKMGAASSKRKMTGWVERMVLGLC